MGRWVHRLSNINKEEKTALCQNCGEVRVYIYSSGVAKCIKGKEQYAEVNRLSRKARGLPARTRQNPERNKRKGELRDSLLGEQEGRCGLCQEAIVEAHLDHCHETGFVRSALCRKCNLGLGFFDDNPSLLRRAAKYVEDHRNEVSGIKYW